MPLWIIFTKWPGARAAHVPPAVLGLGVVGLVVRGEHVEDRRQQLDRLLLAADHHAVADLEAPDASAGAHVDEPHAAARRTSRGGPTDSVHLELPPSTIRSPSSSRSSSLSIVSSVGRRPAP